MALENLFSPNALGWYAFLTLIPFIILYLRRPKIITKTIPSLMFILQQQGSIKVYSFFRNMVTSLLFLMQLLFICLLAYAVTSPYFITKDSSASKTTYLILDASASMQAAYQGSTRFDHAKQLAKDEIRGAVTIIKAGNTLDVAMKDGSSSRASSMLAALEADDSPSNIEAAMHKADTLLEGKKAKIVVISDFMVQSNNDDILKAMRILTSKGNEVLLKDVGQPTENMGIIDTIIDKETTRVYVKNYGASKEAKLVQEKDGITVLEHKKVLEKNSLDYFDFPTQEGVATITLSPRDALPADNILYTSSPVQKNINVVLLTSKESPYLVSALRASKYISLTLKSPPFTIEEIRQRKPDVIITDNLNKNELLPGDFDGISDLVGNGSSIIITAQSDLGSIDFADLLLVKLMGLGKTTQVNKDIINQFTKDVEFSLYHQYFKAERINATTVSASADDGSPLLVFKQKNKGNMVYYGFFDDDADFKTTPGYPILWNNLINFLVETENIADYNKKIAEVPLAKKAGTFKEKDKLIAVNLLDEAESNTAMNTTKFHEERKKFLVDESLVEQKVDIEKYLIIAALIILFAELLYIKIRGDL